MKVGRIRLPGWRYPRRRQHDRSDCGAACLAAVAEYWGLRLPIAQVRQHASTDDRGTTLLGLLEGAQRLGFAAKGVRATRESLPSVPTPAVAHVIVDGFATHFVVIYRVTARSVTVMDPSDGRLSTMSIAAFESLWSGALLILLPSTRFQSVARVSVIGRFWSLVRPHGGVLAQALVGAAAYTLLGLSTAIFVQKLVDYVLPDGNRNLLNLLGLGMLLVLAVQLTIGVLKDIFTLRTGQKIDAALILGYHQHVLRLPQRFFDSMRVGEIVSRVNDAVKIRAFINDVAIELAVNLLVVGFSLALMLLYSWRLGLVVASMLPLYALVYWITNRLNRRIHRRLMETGAELESQLVESISAAATVKRFALEDFAGGRMERRFIRVLRNVYDSSGVAIASRGASDVLSKGVVVGLLWLGGVMVIERAITAGELMSLYALAGYLAGPVVSLVGANRTLQEALIAGDRLFEILDLDPELAGRTARLPSGTAGDIRFEGVTFRYAGREAVFRELDLSIPAGRMTAVVGESGSGKSTLAALVQGVYTPSAGRIRVGGHDVQHLDLRGLRSWVVAVPQQIHLFAGSVIENVAIGDPDPDLRRVVAICEELGIDGFIDNLADGYRTDLGENGVRLSGGQRQRLAIARALYRSPQVVILDEATSSLDSESEAYVHRALLRLRDDGKTVVVIAHRLATIRSADLVVVLERGQVVESGDPEILLRRDGPFRRMWKRQTLGTDDFERVPRGGSGPAGELANSAGAPGHPERSRHPRS